MSVGDSRSREYRGGSDDSVNGEDRTDTCIVIAVVGIRSANVTLYVIAKMAEVLERHWRRWLMFGKREAHTLFHTFCEHKRVLIVAFHLVHKWLLVIYYEAFAINT